MSAPPRVEVVSGLVPRENKFLPSRRSREDGRETTLGVPRRGEANETWRPSAGPSGARGTYAPNTTETLQIMEATRSMFRRIFFLVVGFSWTKHGLWRSFFTWF